MGQDIQLWPQSTNERRAATNVFVKLHIENKTTGNEAPGSLESQSSTAVPGGDISLHKKKSFKIHIHPPQLNPSAEM